MKKPFVYGLAVVSALLVPAAGQAALFIDRNDTDGVIGLADIDTVPGAVEAFDVIYSNIDTTGGVAGSWLFNLNIDDPLEIDDFDSATFASPFSTSGPRAFAGGAAGFSFGYTLGAALANGDLVARFDLTMLAPGGRPHDDLADFTISGLGTTTFQAVNIEDPITGAAVNSASFDVQTVPVPAAGLLLPFGLACLVGLRRRKSRAAA